MHFRKVEKSWTEKERKISIFANDPYKHFAFASLYISAQ